MSKIMHLRAANGTPLCGATKHATTGLLTEVNCPACRTHGRCELDAGKNK